VFEVQVGKAHQRQAGEDKPRQRLSVNLPSTIVDDFTPALFCGNIVPNANRTNRNGQRSQIQLAFTVPQACADHRFEVKGGEYYWLTSLTDVVLEAEIVALHEKVRALTASMVGLKEQTDKFDVYDQSSWRQLGAHGRWIDQAVDELLLVSETYAKKHAFSVGLADRTAGLHGLQDNPFDRTTQYVEHGAWHYGWLAADKALREVAV
jgi:hypothetical protein